ncbi:hypothetical protein [Cohnella sp.]|uniref:hypothetical protein n=1 Tax=Cohnella sp. TaxID=1883426 RepID=UPI0035669DC2
MNDTSSLESNRKTYYVAVGAGQILEDREAAAFEFAIRANEDELTKLQELFEELQDADEDNAFRFSGWPSVSDNPEDPTYNALFKDIYKQLYKLGNEETKRHIESMNILH